MAASVAERRRPLTSLELERLRAAAFPESTALRATPMPGGIVTATYALSVDGAGNAREAVLRCYRGWPLADAAKRISNERRILEAVAPLCALAPRAIYADVSGDVLGDPLLVMSRLPGAPTRPPGELERGGWIAEFARGLATVHAINVDRLPEDFRRETAAVEVLGRVEREAGEDPLSRELLQALHESLATLGETRLVLVHEDYWFGNTLWRDTTLTGIADWGGARIGDRRQDVSLARSDCALFIDLAAADEFLREYESVAGPAGDMVFWDLLSALLAHRWLDEWLIGYEELGVGFSLDEAHRRIEGFAREVLRRAHDRWHVSR